MNWRNILYFQKQDRIAISFLIILISLVGGGVYFTQTVRIENNEQSFHVPHLEKWEAHLGDAHKAHIASTHKKKNPDEKVNINKANIEDLREIPGVGEIIAQRIIEYRTKIGNFTSLTQLKNVKGIGEKKYEAMQSHVCLQDTNIEQ